ncbi:ATP-grasp domain-containing protein [Haliangium ochraceum]|uniref:ATP-grasp domain-containing protein n=1 Tax=Haliangium ochraceum (strain DSM 14365 / JCM 11303 / SMP-2) TaxID=502025 RepID=D0LLC8_HALO1|nr:ATP-grasp domain-containing protein [Haliangium ochraceum]ACY18624.1 conserved hypothetical protein [Haliangium ochraceum DSM 14365]
MNTPAKRALILFGAFASGKYPGFIHYLRNHDYAVLALDMRTPVADAQQAIRRSQPEHVLGAIEAYRYLKPDDRGLALAAIDEWRERFDIRGVYTIREDFVELSQVVADYLELPSPGWRASTVCRDKSLQRHYLSTWSPAFHVRSPGDIESFDALAFPYVVKPARRSGSSGVVVVRDHDGLRRALPDYADDEILLQEKYIDGAEFSVESLVQGGAILFSCVAEKRTNHSHEGGDYFVEMAHTVPAQNLSDDMRARLLEINKDILTRLDFRDGIAHAEFKFDREANPFLMEIAARNPGDGLLQLYQLAFGAPIERALMQIVLGEPASYGELLKRVARQVYLDSPAGRLQSVEYAGDGPAPYFFRDTFSKPELPATQPEDPPSLREFMIEKSRGEQLSEVKQSSDRLGCFFIDAPSGALLDELEASIREAITAKIDTTHASQDE